MRIIRFISDDGQTHFGAEEEDGAAAVLRVQFADDRLSFEPADERRPIVRMLAPIIPSNILCAGRNYSNGTAAGDELELFMKPTTAIAGPGDPILMPPCRDGIDPQLACEGELAVVIGRRARNVAEDDALEHIFGYTLATDVTARRWQTKEGPPKLMRGKGFDTFCPLGPAIVTVDELPYRNLLELEIITRMRVGSLQVQRASVPAPCTAGHRGPAPPRRTGRVGDMIRGVPRLIAQISERITLLPGTLVLTGAPALAAGAKDEPLARGDRVEVHCDAIGTLVNVVE